MPGVLAAAMISRRAWCAIRRDAWNACHQGEVAQAPPTRVRTSGLRPSAVLQTRLIELGYDVHSINGVFGPATASAVRAYQINPAQHLAAEGVVRAATGTSLGILR